LAEAGPGAAAARLSPAVQEIAPAGE
jgi:hypothetical protein